MAVDPRGRVRPQQLGLLIRPSIAEVLSRADTIVVGNGSSEFRSIREHLRSDQILIDLVRAFGAVPAGDPRYQGIAW